MIHIKDVKKFNGEKVEIAGFIKQVRDTKRMQFILVRDITDTIQLSLEKNEANKQLNEKVLTLTPESAVKVTGTVNVTEYVKLNGVEIWPDSIEISSIAQSPLPIDLGDFIETNRDMRLDWRFLDLRRPEHQLIFKVETVFENAMREYWIKEGFMEIHSPKLMANPSESGAELFEVKYFDDKAYLSQSPQFYKQMAIASGFEKVFEIGPAFRAEKSNTTRHAAEFTSVDAEIAWIDSHEDVMKMEEEVLNHAFTKVKEQLGDEIQQLLGIDLQVPALPFPRINIDQAKEIVKGYGHIVPPETKGDLDPEAEKLLGRYAMENFGHEFIFVTEYPASVRPFYHMRLESDSTKTKSFDLIYKGVEVTTGSQREHRYDILCEQAKEKGLDPGSMQETYLNYFCYGIAPHGGFGFGISRLLMNMLNFNNIREVTYLYRGAERLRP